MTGRVVFDETGVVEVESEDDGQALIAEISDGADEGLFVRLQSWSESRHHPAMDEMRGKRVRVTVEIVE